MRRQELIDTTAAGGALARMRARLWRGLCAGLFVAALAPAGHAQVVSANDDDPTSLAREIVGAFDALFSGPHAGTRAVHAKGLLLSGSFEPSAEAVELSRAVHFSGGEVPVLVRFSNFAGLPTLPDGDPSASPRGMSIKFELPDGGSTDIVAHSYNGFPVATPEAFLEFLRALAAPEPGTLQRFLAAHPAAQRFAEAPKPAPESYAREAFYGVDPFVFTNADGESRFARYRIDPVAGSAYLSAEEAATRAPDYLVDEMARRLDAAPVAFRLIAQLAGPEDEVTDGSVAWPSDRPTVDLGTLSLRRTASTQAHQQALLFTPLNLVAGIAPSRDPLLIARNRAYRISYERRIGRIDQGSHDVPASN